VTNAFSESTRFEFEKFGKNVAVAVRMLDNVLDVTAGRSSSSARKRWQSGASAWALRGWATRSRCCACATTPRARDDGGEDSAAMRDEAYKASADLAKERGAFPLFNRDMYLSGASFASLPELKNKIQKNGMRNSHLLSIAPTGTISLAFADNASNGIEPPFSWVYTRKKRMADGTLKEFPVEDHAWRKYKAAGGDMTKLPPTSSPRWRSRRARTSRWWPRWRPTWTPASPRPSTCPRTIPTRSSRTSTCTPGSPA
jgi:ribonucleoside-diphosphate reductase alpha chain